MMVNLFYKYSFIILVFIGGCMSDFSEQALDNEMSLTFMKLYDLRYPVVVIQRSIGTYRLYLNLQDVNNFISMEQLIQYLHQREIKMIDIYVDEMSTFEMQEEIKNIFQNNKIEVMKCESAVNCIPQY